MERPCVDTGVVIHLEPAYSISFPAHKAYTTTSRATYSAGTEVYMIQGLRRILRARQLEMEEQQLMDYRNLEKRLTWGKEREWYGADGFFKGILPCDQVSRGRYLKQGLIPSVCRKQPPINSPVLVSQLYTLALQNWSGTATMLKEAIRYKKSPRLLSREITEATNQLKGYGVSIRRGYRGKKKMLTLTTDKTTNPLVLLALGQH